MADDIGANGKAALDEQFNAATLHLLREQVAGCAATAGITASRAADITLVVHELAANAVRHGPGDGHLLAHAAGGTFTCQVSDTGPAREDWPVRQGHGLWIVRQVADTFDISSSSEGNAVTAVFTSPAEVAELPASLEPVRGGWGAAQRALRGRGAQPGGRHARPVLAAGRPRWVSARG